MQQNPTPGPTISRRRPLRTPVTGVICQVAATLEERNQAFHIRHRVFVEEQGLFTLSDQDEFDVRALHIVAKCAGRIVGTVRVFQKRRGRWIGGRLAVLPGYRSGRVGAMLVREAVKTVESRGARVFLAYIQLQNVRFFQRLGWQAVGPEVSHCGVLHQPMEAALYQP